MAFAVNNLKKSYGGVPVLKSVDLTVEDGEIHALLGANGAGKSTLIKCLSGAITPDSGTIEIAGTSYPGMTTLGARRAGVAVVYQDLSLAMSLNVSDNVFLGRELKMGPFVRRKSQQVRCQKVLHELGSTLNATASLTSLASADLQIIEIAKALAHDPKVLILDEPTASLSDHETERLEESLSKLRAQNLPVLYVTHRLSEVFAFADRVTVLRGGQVVLSDRVSALKPSDVISAIVGREVAHSRPTSTAVANIAPLVEVEDLVAPGIGPVRFSVQPGEVLGVFGLVGSGRTELLETLLGVRDLHGGTIRLDGRCFVPKNPITAVKNGVALVPSDRQRNSVFRTMSARDNVLLSSYSRVGKFGMRRTDQELTTFDAATQRLLLHPARNDLEAWRFSGGNQQKLVVSRWLNDAQNIRLLLLDEPTQGVDVGARSEIYRTLLAHVATGDRSCIVTSSEPEELIQLASRVLVLSGGRAARIIDSHEITEQSLLEAAHSFESR